PATTTRSRRCACGSAPSPPPRGRRRRSSCGCPRAGNARLTPMRAVLAGVVLAPGLAAQASWQRIEAIGQHRFGGTFSDAVTESERTWLWDGSQWSTPGPASQLPKLRDAAQWNATPLPLSLAGLGMPGCSLLVSPDALVVVPVSSGTASLTIAIPGGTGLIGLTVFHQLAVADPA